MSELFAEGPADIAIADSVACLAALRLNTLDAENKKSTGGRGGAADRRLHPSGGPPPHAPRLSLRTPPIVPRGTPLQPASPVFDLNP